MRSIKHTDFVSRQDLDGQSQDKDVTFSAPSLTRGEPTDGTADDRTIANGEDRALAAVYDTTVPEVTLEQTPQVTHPLDASRRPRSERGWLVTRDRDAPPDASRDIEITDRILTLVQELNEAMEAAAHNGLLVEPSLAKVIGRYGNLDEDGGHILSIKLFRKLC